MKRFIFTVLSVAVFFVGLGAVVDNVGAKFKSDEKALDLVRKARVAIGGETAVAGIQSLRIVGQTTRVFKIDGSEKTAQSETEIALQFPDKFMKMTRAGKDDGTAERIVNKQVDVVVVGDAKEHRKVMVDGDAKELKKFTVTADARSDGATVAHKIVIKKDDGTVQELTGDEAAAWIAKHHPGGMGGGTHTVILKKHADGTVEQVGGAEGAKVFVRKADGAAPTTWTSKDGKTVEIIEGEKVYVRKADGKAIETGDKHQMVFERSAAPGGAMRMAHGGPMRQNDFLRTTLALLLTAPQGMDVSYTFRGEGDVDGTACNIINAEFGGSTYKLYLNKSSNLPVMLSYSGTREPQVFQFRSKAPDGAVETKDVMTFTRKIEAAPAGAAEFSVKFSDYRSVNGVQLPYKWTQTVGGAADETFDVTSYEVNPVNIAEKFQNEKVLVRTKKPDTK